MFLKMQISCFCGSLRIFRPRNNIFKIRRRMVLSLENRQKQPNKHWDTGFLRADDAKWCTWSKETKKLWRGFAPNEKLHENATYLRKCKSALQSHKGIISSPFTPFWKAGPQTNVMNGTLGLRDHMEMIIFSLTTFSSRKTMFCSMAMRKSATQICSLINHLEQDIDKLWII